MNRTVFALVTILCLVSVSSITGLIQVAKADGATIYIQADGSITPSTAPITTVDNTTYTFTGNVNESIAVKRNSIVVDGQGYTVQGTGSGTGITLSGSNVTIKNMEITTFYWGISLDSSSNCSTISGNNITANSLEGIGLASSNCSIYGNRIANSEEGIWLYSSSNCNNIYGNNITANNEAGIKLSSSNYNSIIGNDITANNMDGIWLDFSSNHNSIIGNNITANNEAGIWLHSSSNSTISDNTFTNDGLFVLGSYQNSVENNTVNGRPLVYLEGVSNYTVDDAGQVILVRCDNIRVGGLNLSRTDDGIILSETNNSTIYGNTITANNMYGIRLDFSSNYNSIIGNNITANNEGGIWLSSSSSSSIYHNNFVNNTEQVYSVESINAWDDGYPSGGNYWSDYVARYPNASEIDASGVWNTWNTPYVIDANNTDRYPLIAELSPIARALQANLVALNSSYLGLKTDYDALNASFRDYQQTTQNELTNVKNTLYVFIAVTAILAVAFAYMATKNKRFKNEDKGTSTP